jgi:hypothetical protein
MHTVFFKYLKIHGLLTVGYTYIKYKTFRELAVLGFRLSFLGNLEAYFRGNERFLLKLILFSDTVSKSDWTVSQIWMAESIEFQGLQKEATSDSAKVQSQAQGPYL